MSIDRVPVPGAPGSVFLCGLGDVASDPDAALVAADDAALVVCLNEEHELAARHPAYLSWLRSNDGGRARWHPTRDWEARPAEAALPVVLEVAERLRGGDGVLVHCAMGQGRAGTFATCVMLALGVARETALDTVARHRRHAGPASRSQWALVDVVAEHVTTRGAVGH